MDVAKLVLVLKAWLVFFLVIAKFGHSRLAVGNNYRQPARKLANDNPGFISIDCGVTKNYMDERTGIFYNSDTGFVDTGINKEISSKYILEDPYFGQQIQNLRSFPQGTNNCYTLKPDQGKNNNYLIRAFFYYGNYDNKNQVPKFDLHIGVNYWTTVELETLLTVDFEEIIHVPSSDIIFVCLINTGFGIPFISALELRLLDNSTYQTESGALHMVKRNDLGTSSTSDSLVRYKDDVYDRLWSTANGISFSTVTDTISTSSDIDTQSSNDGYKPPAQVLKTALRPLSDNFFTYDLRLSDPLGFTSYQYYLYFHFSEIAKLSQGQRREFNIYCDGVNYLKEPITLDYLKPLSISPQNGPIPAGLISFNATKRSNLPPILNSLELFRVLSLPQLSTHQEDVSAMMDIKITYKITREDWQGDPCVPMDYSWTGLSCSKNNTPIPRIISLHLSSRALTGKIANSFSNLKAIQSLDLSHNDLTGPIPDFLADLPDLKVLNLTGNKLTGSVPRALREKSDNKTLQLSLDDNPNLCQTGSCKKENTKIVVIVVVCVLVLVILGALAIFWKIRRKRQEVKINEPKEEVTKISSNRSFTHSEIVSITSDFKDDNFIGEGGFGKVYRGTHNDTQVAVKRWSTSSRQGYKEFKAEQAHMMVHHKNLVSLVGYCDDGDNKALIYEYMANGNLRQYLSEAEASTKILTWEERLQIALDAARGLEYLHNGCREPIVHRDVKTSNILLDEKWEAKLADFGLSRVFPTENASHISTDPNGTNGYIDPEYKVTKKLTKASDIFGFGVVLLELVIGRPAIITEPNSLPFHISQWVNALYDKGDIGSIVDPRLQGTYYNTDSTKKVIETAIDCVKLPASQRPEISRVCDKLKKSQKLQMVAEGSQRMENVKRSSSIGRSGILSWLWGNG